MQCNKYPIKIKYNLNFLCEKKLNTKILGYNLFIDYIMQRKKRILFPCELNLQILRGPVPKSKIGSHFVLNKVALAGMTDVCLYIQEKKKQGKKKKKIIYKTKFCKYIILIN